MKKVLILILILLLAPSSFAIQEERKISLKDAIELAIRTNPQMELARLDVNIARNKIFEANRLQNPSVHTFQNIPKAGVGNPQQIGVDYTIELFKRGKRKETAKTYSLAVSDHQKFLEYGLISEVKKSYVNLLVKKSKYMILKEQEQLAKELYENIKQEVEKGNLPKTEEIQAKIVVNKSIMLTNVARTETITAQNYFNSVLNTSDINLDTKEDSLPDDYSILMAISPMEKTPDLKEIKDYALNHRFDLLMAQKEVDTAKKNLDVTKNLRIPDVELTGGYSYQTKGMSGDGHFQSGGYVGASLVNIPILYNFKPEIENAKIEIQKAELKYEDIKIDAIRNITDAYEKFVIAKENLNYYNKEILSNSRELMDASRQNLNNKEIDLTTFLVSKKLYLELMLGYQDALGEYYSSYAELLKEINSDSIYLTKTETL